MVYDTGSKIILKQMHEIDELRSENCSLKGKLEHREKLLKKARIKISEKENRINKAIYDLEKVKEVNDKHILARDNIVVHLDIDHIEYLLNILKGDNK